MIGTLATTNLISQAQIWDRPVAPGILYRMEVQKDPSRIIVGLRIDPKIVRLESQIAKGVIYDSTKFNGRDTVSGMVNQFGASAGINGDFFQFGADPGGDPEGLVVRHGELISLPGAKDRALSLVWDTTSFFNLFRPTVELTAKSGDLTLKFNQLNARTAKESLNFTTGIGGQVYGDTKMTVVDVETPNLVLRPNGEFTGKVVSVTITDKRVDVPFGHSLISAIGGQETVLQSLKPGQDLRFTVKSTSIPNTWSTQAIGGWPELLKNSVYAGPKDPGTRHPRTAVGRTADGMIWQVVIDGRQTMSVGASFTETSEIMKQWGCVDAINLDGGGSSAVNAFGLILNRPSGGTERYDANGILAYTKMQVAKANLSLKISGDLKVGVDGTVTVLKDGIALPMDKVILAAQGSAWVKPDGTLVPVTPGVCEIAALVDGQVVRQKVEVAKGP